MAGDPIEFSIATQELDGRLVVTPAGELDLATAPELEQIVMPAVRDGGQVIVDLRRLAFMDSSGVRVLVEGHALAAESAGRLTIVRPPAGSPVDRVIDIAGIARALEMVDELEGSA